MAEEFRRFGIFEEHAKEYGADPDRVDVWDAFSELFLDTSHTEEELDWIATNIARSPFSFRELGHILFNELGPVCVGNLIAFPGGEWSGFDPDWLILKCLERQKANPFKETENLDRIPFFYHVLSPPFFEAYMMLYRVKRMRESRSNS